MIIILVTHADSKDAPPRALSEKGALEARKICGYIAECLGDDFRIAKAVSSPAVRCIETSLVILKELASDTLRRIDTDPKLMAAKEPMESDQLTRSLADFACNGTLVTLHADLANALPHRDAITCAPSGWFIVRPVLAIMDWEKNRPMEENTLLCLRDQDNRPLIPKTFEKYSRFLLSS